MLTDKELKIAKIKYQDQCGNCRGRIDAAGNAIEMRLSFDQWLDIWLSSGHWHERGTKRGQYVMSRFNDIGHYEIGNVEIKTTKENNIEKNSSPEFQSKMKSVRNSPEYQTKNKAAVQKACNKPISCDGVIYPSRGRAANALAPANIKYKGDWLTGQMKKYPERYFYI